MHWSLDLIDWLIDWLSWGLTTRQPLRVSLCRLPQKGRREIEEIVEEMKERDRGERKMNENEETEDIKTLFLFPYLLQGYQALPNWKLISIGRPGDVKIHDTSASPSHPHTWSDIDNVKLQD